MKRIQFRKKMCVYTQMRNNTVSYQAPSDSVCLGSIYRVNASEMGLYLLEENRSALRSWEALVRVNQTCRKTKRR